MIRRPDAAAAILAPTRLRLLHELAEPGSAAGLARRLGLPRQRVNYHLRALEAAGLVELVEERRVRSMTERVVRATARAYLVSPEVLGSLGAGAAPENVRDRFSSAYLVAVASEAVREVAVLRDRAARAGKPLATISMQVEVRFGSAADRAAFAEDLLAEVARLAKEYHDEAAPEGRLYRFFLGGYPAITKADSDGDAADASGPCGEADDERD